MHQLVTTDLSGVQGAKVSFRSSTANAWGMSFLHHLSVELDSTPVQDHRQFMARVCNAAQNMFNARFQALPEVASYTVLGMCLLLLSSYRELVVELGQSGRAFGIVERSFDRAYQAFIQNICKPLFLSSKYSPQALAKMNFTAWSEHMYPKGSRVHDDQRETAATGYQLFFLEQGAPALAQIIHAADQAWVKTVMAYAGSPLTEQRRTRTNTRSDADGTGFMPFHFAPNVKKRQEHVVLELDVNPATACFGRERRRGSFTGMDRRQNCESLGRRQSQR